MIENISRYIEAGDPPLVAALKGSGQIGFTIISLTLSLIAVLIPLLFMMLLLAIAIGLNVYLYIIVPKGFFPQQDTGRLIGFIRADQSISFQAMRQKLDNFVEIVRADPAVQTVTGFTGGGGFGSLDFSVTQAELSKFARVCSYDRAGYGWSDPSPTPRTVTYETDELERLLT